MARKRRLIAGVTASGAVLCLTLSASGHTLNPSGDLRGPEPLPSRVDSLRAKLIAGIPPPGSDAEEKATLQNIVQFFNFFNCSRPGWKNC
jgi:hypothetical protein